MNNLAIIFLLATAKASLYSRITHDDFAYNYKKECQLHNFTTQEECMKDEFLDPCTFYFGTSVLSNEGIARLRRSGKRNRLLLNKVCADCTDYTGLFEQYLCIANEKSTSASTAWIKALADLPSNQNHLDPFYKHLKIDQDPRKNIWAYIETLHNVALVEEINNGFTNISCLRSQIFFQDPSDQTIQHFLNTATHPDSYVRYVHDVENPYHNSNGYTSYVMTPYARRDDPYDLPVANINGSQVVWDSHRLRVELNCSGQCTRTFISNNVAILRLYLDFISPLKLKDFKTKYFENIHYARTYWEHYRSADLNHMTGYLRHAVDGNHMYLTYPLFQFSVYLDKNLTDNEYYCRNARAVFMVPYASSYRKNYPEQTKYTEECIKKYPYPRDDVTSFGKYPKSSSEMLSLAKMDYFGLHPYFNNYARCTFENGQFTGFRLRKEQKILENLGNKKPSTPEQFWAIHGAVNAQNNTQIGNYTYAIVYTKLRNRIFSVTRTKDNDTEIIYEQIYIHSPHEAIYRYSPEKPTQISRSLTMFVLLKMNEEPIPTKRFLFRLQNGFVRKSSISNSDNWRKAEVKDRIINTYAKNNAGILLDTFFYQIGSETFREDCFLEKNILATSELNDLEMNFLLTKCTQDIEFVDVIFKYTPKGYFRQSVIPQLSDYDALSLNRSNPEDRAFAASMYKTLRSVPYQTYKDWCILSRDGFNYLTNFWCKTSVNHFCTSSFSPTDLANFMSFTGRRELVCWKDSTKRVYTNYANVTTVPIIEHYIKHKNFMLNTDIQIENKTIHEHFGVENDYDLSRQLYSLLTHDGRYSPFSLLDISSVDGTETLFTKGMTVYAHPTADDINLNLGLNFTSFTLENSYGYLIGESGLVKYADDLRFGKSIFGSDHKAFSALYNCIHKNECEYKYNKIAPVNDLLNYGNHTYHFEYSNGIEVFLHNKERKFAYYAEENWFSPERKAIFEKQFKAEEFQYRCVFIVICVILIASMITACCWCCGCCCWKKQNDQDISCFGKLLTPFSLLKNAAINFVKGTINFVKTADLFRPMYAISEKSKSALNSIKSAFAQTINWTQEKIKSTSLQGIIKASKSMFSAFVHSDQVQCAREMIKSIPGMIKSIPGNIKSTSRQDIIEGIKSVPGKIKSGAVKVFDSILLLNYMLVRKKDKSPEAKARRKEARRKYRERQRELTARGKRYLDPNYHATDEEYDKFYADAKELAKLKLLC